MNPAGATLANPRRLQRLEPRWRRPSPGERSRLARRNPAGRAHRCRAGSELVRELRRLIAENALQLAQASASARGRPARESLTAEVLPLAEACRFLERSAPRVLAARRLGRRGLPLWLAGVRAEIHREPLGVVLIIGPGNYPLLLPGVQLIQALAAGNAAVLKPGVGGTPAARALIGLLGRAGFDPQLVALLPNPPRPPAPPSWPARTRSCSPARPPPAKPFSRSSRRTWFPRRWN